MKSIRYTSALASVCLLAATGRWANAQQANCPVVSAGAETHANGSITNVGQAVTGRATNGSQSMHAGIGGICLTAPGCHAPVIEWAHSVALHKTGGGSTAEFFVNLNLTDSAVGRTSEPRDSGLNIIEIQFDQDVQIAVVDILGQGGDLGSYPMTLLPGAHGPASLGRVNLGGLLGNARVYTLSVIARSGPGCDLFQDICVAALVGDFDSNGQVAANDKGALLGFIFQPVSQMNAKFDLQVNGISDSGIIEPADVGAWTGFFGSNVSGQTCP